MEADLLEAVNAKSGATFGVICDGGTPEVCAKDKDSVENAIMESAVFGIKGAFSGYIFFNPYSFILNFLIPDFLILIICNPDILLIRMLLIRNFFDPDFYLGNSNPLFYPDSH